MDVERVARGLVVVRVVHAAGDGGVVVAEDRHLGQLADEVGALVGRAAVADGVAEAVVDVDALLPDTPRARRDSASRFAWMSLKIPIRMEELG